MGEESSGELIPYGSLESIQAIHKTGYAVKHDQFSLLAQTESIPAGIRFYYTWHSRKRSAQAELKSFGFTGESCIIPITETEIYRRVRRTIKDLQRAKKRSRSLKSGGRRKGKSSSSA